MRSIFILMAGSFLFFTGCEDDINLKVPAEEQGRLVVLGDLLEGTPARISVDLSRTVPFRPGAIPQLESGAQILLRDQNDSVVRIPETETGRYELSIDQQAGIEIVAGRSYQLDITTTGGGHYLSDWELLHAVPKAEALSFSIVERQTLNESEIITTESFLEFSLTTPLRSPQTGEKVRLRWKAEGVARFIELTPPGPANVKVCYVSEPLNTESIVVFNGAAASDERIVNFPLLEEPLDWRFSRGYYLTIYQYSLSPGAYEFWSHLGQTIEREGGLFEPPAGPVAANIANTADPEEEVLGYFFASAVDTIRLGIKAGEAGAPGQLCDGMTYFEAYDFCRDCLLLPRSTTIQPDYWID